MLFKGLTDRGAVAEGILADIACAAEKANHLAVYEGGTPVA